MNESESLGPYMARYMGAKLYQGENYYLQIDSHSEFVVSWDVKLIKMTDDAPALKPVISTYPPDSRYCSTVLDTLYHGRKSLLALCARVVPLWTHIL